MGIKMMPELMSIQKKMSAIVIALTTLIAIMFGSYYYIAEKSRMAAALHYQAELGSSQLAGNLANPLFDMEDEKIRSVMESAMHERQVYAVIVREEGKKEVSKGIKRDAGWAIAESKEEITGKYIMRAGEIAKDKEKLGVVEVYLTEKFMKATLRNTIIGMVIAASFINLTLFLALFFSMKRIVIEPINRVTAGLNDITAGEGDLTMRLTINSADEVGRLAEEFNTFLDQLREMISSITGNAGTLGESSSTLLELAGLMSEGAAGMTSKSDSASTASETMNANMLSVAANMEQSATNINMVAAATEEMNATVNEIAKNSDKAHSITGEAVSQAQRASAKVGELGKAADEISKVTEVITEISEQTNLLALNATIEAARAGDAGKGFAVVANEIKDLAKQTAGATQDIRSQIEGIQSSTAGTVTEIGHISKVIDEVNEIVATIAAAIEEQSATTQEIAGNVAQASQGIQDVNDNVSQTSSISSVIAGDITEVHRTSGDISDIGGKVNISAEDLAGLAGQLKEMVGKFKI